MKKKKIAFYFIFIFIIFFVIDFSFTIIFKKVQVYLTNDQNYMTNHSTYHHELKKNYNGKGHSGETIRTNSYGLITLNGKNINFIDNKKNYVFLGDSFTQGAGVKYDDTFSGILTKKFFENDINILNLSAVSYSPVIYYTKTKFFIENYNPKFSKLFLFLDISDPYDEQYRYELKKNVVIDRKNQETLMQKKFNLNINQLKKFILENTTITYFVSLKLYNLIFKTKEEINFYRDYGFVINHQANMWTYDTDYFDKEGFKGIELSKKYLLKLKDILDQQKIEFTLLIYPWPGQIYRNDNNLTHSNIWGNWASENNINFINLSPLFFKEDLNSEENRLKIIDKYYLPGDMHLNKEGHKMIADYLIKTLE